MAESAQGHAADEELNENGAREDANENDAGADDANENGARGDANENGAGGDANENGAGGDANENGAGGDANEDGARGDDANQVDANANEGLNPRDLRELQKFSNLVISRATEINKRLRETSVMGTIGHWYDAKVPVNDKRFYNFVSLKTCTDKSHMSGIMQRYKVFYEELKNAGEALRQAARDGSVDADNILTLYNRASQMLERAQQGKDATNSKTLYAIHDVFIETQEPLENVIRRVECVALRQQLRQVTRSWRQANDQINEMRQELQGVRADNREIQRRLDDISATNQQMAQTVQTLLRENEAMAQNQQILMEQNQIMTNLLRDVLDRGDD